MPKWEYCEVDCSSTQPGAIYYLVADRPAVVLKTFSDPNKAIAFLGMQGWEAFAMSGSNNKDWCFKRPIEEGA